MSGAVINGSALCDGNEDGSAGNDSSRTCTLPGGSMDSPTLCDPRQDNTVEDGVWTYDAERLRAKLASIPTQGKDMDEVTANVKNVCCEEGVQVATSDSRKGKDGRWVSRELKCKLGMRNRQNDHKAKDGGKTVPKIRRKSQRIGCPFKVAIRWPTHRKAREHPYLSERATTLTHNHTVTKDVDTIPLPKRKASSDSLVMANPYKLRESEAKKTVHETRDDKRDRTEGLRATAFDRQKAELEYSTTEILAINNAIMAVGDEIHATIFSCQSSTRYSEWYTRVAVHVQEELRKNQEYMEEYGMSLDTRFGRGQMRHLLLWFQDQQEMERKARKTPTGESNEKSPYVNAADVEVRIKHEGFQPSDGGTALAGDLDGVEVKDEAGGSGLGKTSSYLNDEGKEPRGVAINGAGSGVGSIKDEGNKRSLPSDREARNDGGGGGKVVGVERKGINAASSGQVSTGAEGEGSKTKRPTAGTESARVKRRRCSSIDETICMRVESRGGEALSGDASGSGGLVGHGSTNDIKQLEMVRLQRESRVKQLRDLYHDTKSACSSGHATDDDVKAAFKQYREYVLGNDA
ncbi:unnamed protein product [Ectocarpus sp. 8 AP-2014]